MDEEGLAPAALDWTEPVPPPLGRVQVLVYAVLWFLIYQEICWMWTWCRWFTNCS